jgi:hypothetical protein
MKPPRQRPAEAMTTGANRSMPSCAGSDPFQTRHWMWYHHGWPALGDARPAGQATEHAPQRVETVAHL